MATSRRAPIRALACGTVFAALPLLAPGAFRGDTAKQSQTGFRIERIQKVYRVPTGEQVHTYHSTYARRADGSSVEIRRIVDPDGNVREQRKIIDLVQKRQLLVDGLTESVTTYPLTGPEMAALTQEPACAARGAERAELLGLKAVRAEENVKTPKGTELRIEKWLAPGLGCLPLRERVFTAHAGGPFQLAWEQEVTSFERSDPPAEWFEVPAGYIERAPSAVLGEFDRRFPTSCSQYGRQTGEVLDAVYSAHQAADPRSRR